MTHKGSGKVRIFDKKTDFSGRAPKNNGGWLAKQNKQLEGKRTPQLRFEDFIIEHVVEQSKDTSEGCKRFDEAIKRVTSLKWCKDFRVVIGGEGNYRFDAAFTQPYKGQRPEKSAIIGEIKDYIVNAYGDKVIQEDGIEADDVVSYIGWWDYSQGGGKVVISHIDKDINQVPCLHHNPQQVYFDYPQPELITYDEAAAYFWKQMLIGDTTDNILGLPNLSPEFRKSKGLRGGKGCGEKTAGILIDQCKNEQEMLHTVSEAYESHYGNEPHHYYHTIPIWFHMMSESFVLLRLQDKKGIIPSLDTWINDKGYTAHPTQEEVRYGS